MGSSFLWRFYFSFIGHCQDVFLGHRKGFLELSLLAAAPVGAYRLLTRQPLFGGLFDLLLRLATCALLVRLWVTLTGKGKAP